MNSNNGLEYMASILKTIAHPIKLEIIKLLHEHKSLNVSDIQNKLDCNCEQSMLSHHLVKMKDKGILKSTKVGKYNSYTLMDENIFTIFECFNKSKLNK